MNKASKKRFFEGQVWRLGKECERTVGHLVEQKNKEGEGTAVNDTRKNQNWKKRGGEAQRQATGTLYIAHETLGRG